MRRSSVVRLGFIVICVLLAWIPAVQPRTYDYLTEIDREMDRFDKDRYSPPQDPRVEDIADNIMIDVLELKEMDIIDVLKLLSEKSGLNIISGQNVSGRISIFLKSVPLKEALRIILDANNLAYRVEGDIVRVMTSQEFQSRYGYPFGGNIETRIVELFHANAIDVVTVLNQIKSPSGKIVFDMKSNTLVLVDTKEKIDLMRNLIEKIDVPVETEFFELTYANAKDIAEKVGEMLTENVGRIKFDERSNKIAVTETPSKLRHISKVIRSFDTREKQVLIEAQIIQVVLSDQYKYGVDWEAIVRDYHELRLTSNFDKLGAGDKTGKLTIGSLENDDYTALVEALNTVGETNILSSPSITTINNQEARILVGSTEPYVTTTVTTPSSGPTTTAESVQFIEVGVKLYVTPTIHKNNFITMKIKPEVSSVTQTLTTSQNNTIPVVETSEAETTVMIKDGVTVVIGGLIKDERIDSFNKVPLLGDIPVIGLAFKNSDQFTRKTEIVIFLTPKIISGDLPIYEMEHSEQSAGVPKL